MPNRIHWIVLAVLLVGCGPAQVESPEAQSQAPYAETLAATDALLIEWKARGGELRPLELDSSPPAYGEEVIPIGMYAVRALSPDGRTLAALIYPRNDVPRDAQLLWIDIPSWQARISGLGFDAWVSTMAFSPDGSSLAIATASPAVLGLSPDEFNLQLIDVASDDLIAEADLDVQPLQIAFSTDGDLLSAYGPAPFIDTNTPSEPPVVSVFGGRDLTRLGSLTLEGVVDGVTPVDDDSLREPFLWWSPAVMFSPDGRTLYVIHADEDRLTRVDLAQRRVTSVEIRPPRSWVEQLLAFGVETAYAKGAGGGFRRGVISPDGTRLYSVGSLTEPTLDDQGNLSFSTTYLGLTVIDASTGVELARLDTQADEISVGFDGEQIFLHGWGPGSSGWTDVVNAATLEAVNTFDHARLFSAQDSAGRWRYIAVIGSNSSIVKIYDPASGAELAKWQFGTANGAEVIEIP
jgi:WD40 repeat protein